jgi:transcriptional regulator with XRE-family HTH domain
VDSPARTFGGRLKEALELVGLTQRQLGVKVGKGESLVSKWIKGESEPKHAELVAIARAVRRSADYLLGLPEPARPGTQEGTHDLPKVAFASAGEPVHDLPDLPESWYAFHRSWVKRVFGHGALSDDQRLVVVQVERTHLGESMLPTIRPGAILVVDRGPGGHGVRELREVVQGGIYVARPEGDGLTVKRVNVDRDANLILTADNPDRKRYPPRTLFMKGRELQKVLIGRVRWIGQEEE